MARNNMRTQIKQMTVGAMLCALGVVILALGSFVEVVDISAAAIASLLCVYAVIELGGIYPWMVWIVTSVVAALLLPQKTPVLFYALLAGYYPILKEKIERRTRGAIPWLLKGCVFLVACGGIYLVSSLFLPTLLEDFTSTLFLILFCALAAVVFFLYDICLTRLITFYMVRLRQRMQIK